MEKGSLTKNHLSAAREKWEEKHGRGEWTGGKWEIKRVIDFFDQYKRELGREVLDIGSGCGRNAIPLARRGHDVTCLELTEEGLKKTKVKLEAEELKANLVQGDQSHLPFQNEKFDSVVSVQSFQFNVTKWDAEKSFAEAARVLKLGGIFFLRVRSEDFFDGNHKIFDEAGSLESRGYSLAEIMHLAAANNLEIIEEPVDSYKDDRGGNIIKKGQWNIVMRKKKK